MKEYQVVLSEEAENDLDRILEYLLNIKHNKQAANNVFHDYRATRKELSKMARIIKEPDSENLRKRGLKRINFLKHGYFMLYKMNGEQVIITNIFHVLEDFENKLR